MRIGPHRRGDVDWETLERYDGLWRAAQRCERAAVYVTVLAVAFALTGLIAIGLILLAGAGAVLVAGFAMSRVALDRNRPFLFDPPSPPRR